MLELIGKLLPEMQLDYFLLLFIRMSALIFSSPIFGSKRVPSIVKIGLCLTVTYLMYAYLPATEIVYTHWLTYAFMCISELIFGLILGYATTAFIQLVFTSGQMIDMQMGFGMAGVSDAQSDIQVPVVGNFLSILMIISFFGVNGHLKLIGMLQASVNQIPIGHVTISPGIAFQAMEMFALSFILAINVALPIIAASLLTELTMGVLIRTVPQMNVFVVGIPVKVLMGLLMLLFVIPIFVAFTGVIFDNMFSSIEQIFSYLIGVT